MPKTRNLPVKTYTLYGMGRICTHINGVSLVRMYTVSQKVSLLTLDNNFGKCGPIFKSLSPADSQENSTSPAICWYYTLWKSKIQKCYWFWQLSYITYIFSLRALVLQFWHSELKHRIVLNLPCYCKSQFLHVDDHEQINKIDHSWTSPDDRITSING